MVLTCENQVQTGAVFVFKNVSMKCSERRRSRGRRRASQSTDTIFEVQMISLSFACRGKKMPQNDSFRHSEKCDENLAREPTWVQTAWCTFRAKSDRLAASPARTQISRCARIQKPAIKAVAPSAPRSHSIP